MPQGCQAVRADPWHDRAKTTPGDCVISDCIPPIIAHSPSMRRVLQFVDDFAQTTVPSLLIGATGTGKDVLARHIHARSGRSGEFAIADCGALPRELAEARLFGHRRGAFTGAVSDGPGII